MRFVLGVILILDCSWTAVRAEDASSLPARVRIVGVESIVDVGNARRMNVALVRLTNESSHPVAIRRHGHRGPPQRWVQFVKNGRTGKVHQRLVWEWHVYRHA